MARHLESFVFQLALAAAVSIGCVSCSVASAIDDSSPDDAATKEDAVSSEAPEWEHGPQDPLFHHTEKDKIKAVIESARVDFENAAYASFATHFVPDAQNPTFAPQGSSPITTKDDIKDYVKKLPKMESVKVSNAQITVSGNTAVYKAKVKVKAWTNDPSKKNSLTKKVDRNCLLKVNLEKNGQGNWKVKSASCT